MRMIPNFHESHLFRLRRIGLPAAVLAAALGLFAPAADAKRLAAGAAISCAIDGDSVLKCWGNGAVGHSNESSSLAAVPVAGMSQGSQQVAVGSGHSCAVGSGGRVRCWGGNASGQLGNNSFIFSYTPVDSVGLASGMRDVATGEQHSCAVSTANAVYCWGSNNKGQLGDNSTTQRLTPVSIAALAGTATIVTGDSHSCALSTGGAVKCWGDNSKGQLGDGTTLGRLTPTAVSGLGSGVAAIAAGGDSSCALLSGGGVRCWGANDNGQLGDGTLEARSTPTAVLSLSGIAEISLGQTHACARNTAGTVYCWGGNYYGELGDGTLSNRLSPVPVNGMSGNATEIAAGHAHTCVRLKNQALRCFGYRYGGRLGDGRSYGSNVPQPQSIAALPAPVDRLSAGGIHFSDFSALYGHSCAVTAEGAALCWGSNYNSQSGDGLQTSEISLYGPQPVFGAASSVSDIGSGISHGCLLTRAGAVKCWGSNSYGQVGDNSTSLRVAPQDVIGAAAQVTRLGVGGDHSCARTSTGAVRCWGRNQRGQLGDGTTQDRRVATNVSGLGSGVSLVSAGGAHSCALTGTGGLKCWGDNTQGQLGDGTLAARATPVDVSGLSSGVAGVSTGERHTCALLISGAVKCWGDNSKGQLGDNSTSSSPLPVDVIDLGAGSTAAISAGGAHTCARSRGRALLCWGANDYGQLGVSGGDRAVPVPVPEMQAGIGAFATGAQHSCAVRNDLVYCFGRGQSGQLGNGDGRDSAAPVPVAHWRVAGDLIFRNGFQ